MEDFVVAFVAAEVPAPFILPVLVHQVQEVKDKLLDDLNLATEQQRRLEKHWSFQTIILRSGQNFKRLL